MIRLFVHKLFIITLSVTIPLAGMPLRALARRSAPRTLALSLASTAGPGVTPVRDPANLLRFGALAYASEPDSTEEGLEFPEDEGSHLARDITVFVIVSAFVGYFIIKVFLEGDTDEETDTEPPGKVIP